MKQLKNMEMEGGLGCKLGYPFGSFMPGRVSSSESYRYRFNEKEKDPEGMGGSGSTYDYGFRIYNPNIARFLSVDPLAKSYTWYTPYQFAGNKPIWAVDLDGLEEKIVTQTFYDHGLGQIFIQMQNSEKLNAIWNSVNRADLEAKVTVYYGVMCPSERGGDVGGYTVNLKGMADYVFHYFVNTSQLQKNSEAKKTYEDYVNLFATNGLNMKDIISMANSNKPVFGVFLDPGSDEKIAAFYFFHELEAHLKNRVNGIKRTTRQEHYKFFNYKENTALLNRYPELVAGEKSPSYDATPSNSRAGEIKEEIETIYSGQTTLNPDANE